MQPRQFSFIRDYLFILLIQFLCASSVLSDTLCRCASTDDCWPSDADWAKFNASIGGRLVATAPLASVCHEPNYDADACNALKLQWTSPFLHDEDSSSIMAAAVSNLTCDPFTPPDKPCTLGNMVSYAVNATGPEDYASSIQFAHRRNIRLVIRNTGHDYLGRSTGANALSIWTHHLKNITFLNYTSPQYQGPAVKILAGVQVEDVYAAADAKDMVVVGGDCASVGVAGGWTQGGGHSPLSSLFGMGADQTLEWEVVDGRGRLLKASPTENPRLYWALSGGGAGTYGIVYSLTVKAHKGVSVTGVVMNFTSADISKEVYYQAIEEYHHHLPEYTAAGGVAIGAISVDSFSLTPLALPNMTADAAKVLLTSLTSKLDGLGLPYHCKVETFPSFFAFYKALIEPNPTQLVQNGQYGGWFIPLDVIKGNNSGLTSAVRKITQEGAAFTGIGLNVSSPSIPNAVHPGWRESAINVILSSPWPQEANLSDMASLAKKMTNEWVPAVSALAPESGAYMNEADPQQPDWQNVFYGPNYDELLRIKQEFDPHDIFYAWTAVGSDRWFQNSNDALCRTT
ncbi:isoamyl alcohol oxidase [Zopfia rhizophila CBS 207.26]|uniref:Isoamyl alcohol oxidase n=1 Tax=Zopfia rhizophila CBS 207.26 TaxID=1314779 RepID=A0A6A6DUT4_9PEZI|nr:isoamyl alcohol oxidase [Zopfia rhizophila CBS 207.26]